jgi:hypothetical protein
MSSSTVKIAAGAGVRQSKAFQQTVLDDRELLGSGVMDPPRPVCRDPVEQPQLAKAVDDRG